MPDMKEKIEDGEKNKNFRTPGELSAATKSYFETINHWSKNYFKYNIFMKPEEEEDKDSDIVIPIYIKVTIKHIDRAQGNVINRNFAIIFKTFHFECIAGGRPDNLTDTIVIDGNEAANTKSDQEKWKAIIENLSAHDNTKFIPSPLDVETQNKLKNICKRNTTIETY